MDEVITCFCRNQSWVIGTSGVRCSKCGYWLNKGEIDTDVTKVNKRLDNVKADNALIDSYLRKYGMSVDEYGSTEEILKTFVKFCQDSGYVAANPNKPVG